jgi:RNA polymerase sigma factor (sigma-70 family)
MVDQLAEAMRRILNREQRSWEKLDCLLNLYLNYLLHQHAYKFCVWIDGEDILQDTKIRIHRGLEKITDITDFETQNEAVEILARSVRRIVRQATIDQIRRLKGESSPFNHIHLDDADADAYERLLMKKATAYETILAKELTSDLTLQEKEILYLNVVAEMSLREIAAELNSDKSTVHRVMVGVLKKLVKKVLPAYQKN